MSAQLIIALVFSLAILVGNTMIAVAFLRSRGSHWKSARGGQADAMDELHRRVQQLTDNKK